MSALPLSRHRATPSRAAVLRLRGRTAPLRAQVHWPAPAPRSRAAAQATAAPLLVCLCDAADAPSPQDTDTACRALSVAAAAVVVSVPHLTSSPAAVYDAFVDAVAVMEWVADHSADLDADPGMLIVAGQGAGGGLAAAVALHVRDHGWPTLAHQILAFPRLSPPLADDGIQETGSALPRPSVMRSLAGVAPATVLTSVAGSLCRDDGRSYAARLRRDGVQVTELRYSGRFHGCPCHGDGAICDGLPRAPPPWSLRPCPATSSRFRGAGSSA